MRESILLREGCVGVILRKLMVLSFGGSGDGISADIYSGESDMSIISLMVSGRYGYLL